MNSPYPYAASRLYTQRCTYPRTSSLVSLCIRSGQRSGNLGRAQKCTLVARDVLLLEPSLHLALGRGGRPALTAADERDRVQKKTFTKWVNKHLMKVRKHINDLYEDLRDGHNLISLLEVLSGVKLVSLEVRLAPLLSPPPPPPASSSCTFPLRSGRVAAISSCFLCHGSFVLVFSLRDCPGYEWFNRDLFVRLKLAAASARPFGKPEAGLLSNNFGIAVLNAGVLERGGCSQAPVPSSRAAGRPVPESVSFPPSPQVRKHINDLYEDLRDGHNLISLLEVLSGVKLTVTFS
nr:PREDICTED: uncharacterized protein LOC106493283 [Apteryx mantelli mantelli]